MLTLWTYLDIPIRKLWDEQSAVIQKEYGKESLDRQLFYSIDVFMKLAVSHKLSTITNVFINLSFVFKADWCQTR